MTVSAKYLRRDRVIAWGTVFLSLVALFATKPKDPLVLALLFFAMLGALVWILVIGVQLRRPGVEPHLPSPRQQVLWRVAFLTAFAIANIYWCYYLGLAHWQSWWGMAVMAILCVSCALLLWRQSPTAKYLLYATTLYMCLGALASSIYSYVQNPALMQSPIVTQVIAWSILGVPAALLFNCCLYARRIRNSCQ